MTENKRPAFDTLNGFQRVLSSCQVTNKGTQIQLEKGLLSGVHMIQSMSRVGKKAIFVGNGGSAAIASHQSVDLWKNGGIRAIGFNDASLLTCAANDFGYPEVFAKPIEMFADKGDLLLAISSSGKSVNILNAVEAGRKVGCTVITFSGFSPSNPLRLKGDLNFYLDSMSYGIVEVGHLLLIHAMIDEVIGQSISEGRLDTLNSSRAIESEVVT